MTNKKSKKLTNQQKKWRDQFNAEWRLKRNQMKRDRIAQTTLEQRKIFIETYRETFSFKTAMEKSGISDERVMWEVYMRNSRPSKTRYLVEPEEVK